jgi:pilus assembly protein CpaB
MKATRGIVMLVVALLAGLAAVLLAARWMQEQSQARGGRIAVASVDIDLGSRISTEMVRMADWPTGSVPAGAFTDLKQLSDRVAKSSLTRGEPILENKLAPVGTKGGLSAVVGEGKRAITVRVNDVIGVAGFALPGNFVDIMVNTQEEASKPDDKGRNISKIVLEHILVLAVAQQANRDETKPKVVNAVTLEVTPEQAEKLDLARSVGSLSLVLRNQVDPDPARTPGATKDTLLGIAPPPQAPAPVVRWRQAPRQVATVRRSNNCVEVIRGASRSMECF